MDTEHGKSLSPEALRAMTWPRSPSEETKIVDTLSAEEILQGAAKDGILDVYVYYDNHPR